MQSGTILTVVSDIVDRNNIISGFKILTGKFDVFILQIKIHIFNKITIDGYWNHFFAFKINVNIAFSIFEIKINISDTGKCIFIIG